MLLSSKPSSTPSSLSADVKCRTVKRLRFICRALLSPHLRNVAALHRFHIWGVQNWLRDNLMREPHGWAEKPHPCFSWIHCQCLSTTSSQTTHTRSLLYTVTSTVILFGIYVRSWHKQHNGGNKGFLEFLRYILFHTVLRFLPCHENSDKVVCNQALRLLRTSLSTLWWH